MRRLLLLALALGTLPALAQTDADAPREVEREILIDRDDDGDGPMTRRLIIVDGDTTLDERRVGRIERLRRDGRDVFIERDREVFDDEDIEILGDGEQVRLRIERDGDEMIVRQGDGASANVVRLRMPGLDAVPALSFGDGMPPGILRAFGTRPGTSPETRERMQTLEREARDHARTARQAEGADRDAAVRELDAVLAELFEVRGQARREQAEALRERAAELAAEADDLDAATRDRQARRQALIDARRAELLGDRASDW